MRNIPIMKPYFDEKEAEAVADVLETGWVAQGQQVSLFEKAIASYGGNRFGIATTNCTTALHLCMVAMGFTKGDDVLVPSYTFVATPNSVEYTGATAVLVEVNCKTYNIDPTWTTSYIHAHYAPDGEFWRNKMTGNKLAGIVPVHLFGLCAEIEAINHIAKTFNLKTVEDSACALGAMIGNVHQGKFGNPSTLSFHPRKSITTGEGGMILTDDEDFANHVRKLRSHAASLSEIQRHQNKGYLLPDFDELGYNYRMTDIQGAIGLAQTAKLDWIANERKRIAARYDDLLTAAIPFLHTPFAPNDYTHVYQTYACMLNTDALQIDSIETGNRFRNKLMDELEQMGIATRQGTHATHLLGYYREKYGYQPTDLPNAYACDRLSIALPLYVGLSETDQDFVVAQIAEIGATLRKHFQSA